MRRIVLITAILSAVLGCGTRGSPDSSRPFALGFTPFPYDITVEAVEYSYEKIRTDADMVAHHFDNGIPWPEALSGSPYHPYVMSDWEYRRENTPPGHVIYVAVTPINFSRDGLASYWAEEGGLPLPEPWDTYDFDHPDVKTAYLNYCASVIDYFSPDYFCMAIEVNLLMLHSPSRWDAFIELHRYVYDELKAMYPDLVIMTSMTAMDLLPGYTEADEEDQARALSDIEPYTDYFGISFHAFLSALLADTIPPDLCERVFSLSTKTPFVCETSYPAETFSIFGGSLVFNGSEEKQDSFFAQLFTSARAHGARGIVNFVIRDYDALWTALGSPDDITKVWRDTGFYDEDGNPRMVRTRWMDQLGLRRE